MSGPHEPPGRSKARTRAEATQEGATRTLGDSPALPAVSAPMDRAGERGGARPQDAEEGHNAAYRQAGQPDDPPDSPSVPAAVIPSRNIRTPAPKTPHSICLRL